MKCTLPIQLSVNSPYSSIFIPLIFKVIFFFQLYFPIPNFKQSNYLYDLIFYQHLKIYFPLSPHLSLVLFFCNNSWSGVQSHNSQHLLAAQCMALHYLIESSENTSCKFCCYFRLKFVQAPYISMRISSRSAACSRLKPQSTLCSNLGSERGC